MKRISCFKCDSDDSEILMMENGQLNARCSVCDGYWKAGFSELLQAIENSEECLRAPELALQARLTKLNTPVCFGLMKGRKTAFICEYERIPSANTPEAAFRLLIGQKVQEAEQHAAQLAKCAYCEFFSRCEAISSR